MSVVILETAWKKPYSKIKNVIIFFISLYQTVSVFAIRCFQIKTKQVFSENFFFEEIGYDLNLDKVSPS